MPVVESVTLLGCPIEQAWDFLIRPANLAQVSPPDLNMQLVEGPEVLSLGARITVQGRRWGVTQQIVSEVTAFTPQTHFVDEQVKGPFKKFTHSHHLESAAGGTQMTDRIEFEAPGGLLGLVMTESRIRQELGMVFAFRTQRFGELFNARPLPT